MGHLTHLHVWGAGIHRLHHFPAIGLTNVLLLLLLMITTTTTTTTNGEAQPTPPKEFPPQFFAWLMTTVTVTGQTTPHYIWGQSIAYDSKNNVTLRFNQQNLLNVSQLRPNDYCDYVKGYHYRVNDTNGSEGSDPPCDGIYPTGSFSKLVWPEQFVSNATYMGTDPVNNMFCDHFYMRPIVVNGKPYQIDIWTSIEDQYPCQISIQDIPPSGLPITITTLAFTGIVDNIPPQTFAGTVAKLQCTQRDWACVAKSNASSGDLQQALDWVCAGYIDCSPINPGGSHYYPNTLLDHCNWAFDTYFKAYKVLQGYNACNFGGTAQLIPPTVSETEGRRSVSSTNPLPHFGALPDIPFFVRDLVCPRKNM